MSERIMNSACSGALHVKCGWSGAVVLSTDQAAPNPPLVCLAGERNLISRAHGPGEKECCC
jgi:hypothetical protein